MRNKICNHDWELIGTHTVEDEYSYESGNQFLIASGYTVKTFRCRKCGLESTEEHFNWKDLPKATDWASQD